MLESIKVLVNEGSYIGVKIERGGGRNNRRIADVECGNVIM